MPDACRRWAVTGKANLVNDFWLVQLFVLIRAAREPVSEGRIIAYVERSKIEVTTSRIRNLLSSLIRNGLIQRTDGDDPAFVATSSGRKAAAEAHARLSRLVAVLNSRSKG